MPISPKQPVVADAVDAGAANAFQLQNLPRLSDHIKQNGLIPGVESFDEAMQQFFLEYTNAMSNTFTQKPP